jgi:hypothetical protein
MRGFRLTYQYATRSSGSPAEHHPAPGANSGSINDTTALPLHNTTGVAQSAGAHANPVSRDASTTALPLHKTTGVAQSTGAHANPVSRDASTTGTRWVAISLLLRILAVVLFISLILPQCAMAQRINFRTLAGSADIDVQVVGLPELNFNDASRVIVVGSGPLLIGRNSFEEFIVPVRIEAPADYELTVTVSAPLFLQLEGFIPSEGQPTPTLPFQVGWGYWNRAAGNLVPGSGTGGLNGTETELLSGFVEVVNPSTPVPFTSVWFPVRRSTLTGAPAPPPTPQHGGYVVPRAEAFIYVYGQIGPVAQSQHVGTYSGEILVEVDFSTNEVP